MSSLALDTFHKLMEQVTDITAVAESLDSRPNVAASLRRSAYVLTVAALDTYFHQHTKERLLKSVKQGQRNVTRVADYLSHVTPDSLGSELAEGIIHLRLSYKTLVSPSSVDRAITAWGGDPDSCWMEYSLYANSRPDRERRTLELIYDRRNQIAHEGDWDFVQLDFRPMDAIHLRDCTTAVVKLAEGFDAILQS